MRTWHVDMLQDKHELISFSEEEMQLVSVREGAFFETIMLPEHLPTLGGVVAWLSSNGEILHVLGHTGDAWVLVVAFREQIEAIGGVFVCQLWHELHELHARRLREKILAHP